MFTEYIYTLFEQLVNAQVAEIFTAPFALLIVLLLIAGLFTMFSSGKIKMLVLTFILIVVLIFCVYSMASSLGFITLPVVLGGT